MIRRNRRSEARIKALKYKPRTCPLCGNAGQIQGHHLYKFAIFEEREGFDEIVWLCSECHAELEELIRERENAILRQYPKLYTKALTDYINGVRPRQARSRRRKNGRKVLCV